MPILIDENGGGPDKSKSLTATAADIAWGKTALVNGRVVVGTMGTLLKDMPVGSIIKSEVGGVLCNFIVVHQGKPSDIYSSTFDNSTVLLMEDIYENRQWHSSNVNDYAASTIHAYLNGDFLGLCSDVIKNNVKQVKVPYRPGSGYSTSVNSGENGLAAKLWLPSGYEVGWTDTDSAGFIPDGAKFDFFLSGSSAEANKKRIGHLNGTATIWWLRSPQCNYNIGSALPWYVEKTGNWNYNQFCTNANGIHPALVLPDTMMVLPDGTLVG